MKTKIRIFSTALSICLILGFVLSLSSCKSSDPVGITTAKINSNGELIIVYDNGRTENLGNVVGKNGTLS